MPRAIVRSSAEDRGVRYEQVVFAELKYHVFRIDPTQTPLSLFWKHPDGQPFGNFESLRTWLAANNKDLVFATNAGIYARDFTPLGLHLEKRGETPLEPLNRKRGGGNFFLKPNGVFFIEHGKPHILETEVFAKLNPSPDLAVQSGPLLVSDGRFHPRFEKDSTSFHVRSGVGVNASGETVFALSVWPVNLYTFATFFRDGLACPNALYLDGSISAVYAPLAGRTGPGAEYVGILAVVAEKDDNHDQG